MTTFTAMTAWQATAFWAAILVLWMVVLSLGTVMSRRRHRVAFGDGGQDPVVRASRAFGNAAEYIPSALILMSLLSQLGASSALVFHLGLALFVGRLLHAWGIVVAKRTPNIGRLAGMVLTYGMLITGAAALLMRVL